MPKRDVMSRIGCMIWRVDGVLDLYEQVARVQALGFEAVEFWTLPGQPGVWQGFDVLNASRDEVKLSANDSIVQSISQYLKK